MEKGTKFRLVRCPKCSNLLPEVPNVAVYQCGGCGAVLQAKNQSTSSGGSSEKSDEERVGVSPGKLESFLEKGEGEDMSGDASEVPDRESNGIKDRQRRDSGFPNRTADSNSSSSSRPENKGVNENTGAPIDGWVHGNDNDMSKSRGKSITPNLEKEIRPNESQMIASRSTRSGQIPNWRSGERDGSIAYRRTPRAVAEDVRFSGGPYPDEGTSNFHPGSYGLVEPLKNSNNLGGPGRVEHLEQDRAELLRKLDELNMLKDQLARSCDVGDIPKERPLDPYVGRDTWFPEGSSRPDISKDRLPVPGEPYVGRGTWLPDGLSRQQRPSMPPRPLYSNHGLEPIPLTGRHGIDMHNFYSPLMHASNEIPGYRDTFAPQMANPVKPPLQYLQYPSHDYMYMDMDPEHNASYPANTFFHQPACSCVHCYNKHWHASAQVPPNRRFLETSTNPVFYHVENRGTYGSRGYNPRETNPPPMRHETTPNLRRQRDLDAESPGFGQSRPRRLLPVKRNGRRCCPIAGGAPFITCHNCFELLSLPKKLLLVEKKSRKLRCGACSTIISLLFESRSIIVSVPAETDVVSPVVNDRSAGVVKDDLLHSHGPAKFNGGAYSSDCDSSGYNFHLTDTEPGTSPMDRRLHLSDSENLQGLVSSCSTSEDEESPDSVIARREVSNTVELPFKAKGTPPLPGSPVHEYSSANQVGSKFEKGNRSKRINQEEMFLNKATSRQNSVKDASFATEIDVSFNEYSNGGMSQDYGDVSKEEQPRVSKFVGHIKKGFRDLSKSHQTGENDRSNILVNGQLIPERVVKKAEKHAGPIHPGQYWYDFRAGFWGVMGLPCLGIVPPFIEEFNYPMPKKCAGGNTGIYVNGRELHQKDLDLLVNRGLPIAADKSYIIEISGRVWDEKSGEELDNLGKLAPTVEKLKHGFGMRVPRSAA